LANKTVHPPTAVGRPRTSSRRTLLKVWKREVRPPNSPDFHLVDFLGCGVTASRVDAATHDNTAALLEKIKEKLGFIDRDAVATACRRFQSSVEVVRAFNGDFNE